MNILLLGSGGREHALAWKMAQSPRVARLYAAPGNPGIARHATLAGLRLDDHAGIVAFCREAAIDFVVVGPEAPLVAGLVDDLAAAGVRAFGPTRVAAQLEGSKGFTKDLCREAGIPTAAYGRFRDAASASAYLATQAVPIVVKADGLAAGKGVVIAETHTDALAAVDACFAGAFGAAGGEVVIEEFLVGEEVSFFALTDGVTPLAFGSAQDHKRVGDGDTGPNTGGMGAYAPASVVTPTLEARVMGEIIEPTLATLRRRGITFRGVLFAGLMITADGPKLIEYNCRFGDPECQVLMLRLKSDLVPLLAAAAGFGALADECVDWYADAALTVVMAARGYPAAPETGTEIGGLGEAMALPGIEVFHAGTRQDGDRLVAAGGRVLNIAARGATVAEAQARAYAAVDALDWPGGFCRHDIGWRAV